MAFDLTDILDVTSGTALDWSHSVIMADPTEGSFILILPNLDRNQRYLIRNISTDTTKIVTLDRNGANINGVATNCILYSGQGLEIVSNDSGWWVLDHSSDEKNANFHNLIVGAKLNYSSVSQVKIGVSGSRSCLRDSTNMLTMQFSDELTSTITTSGKGGLDTGSEAADTWYAVHVIGDTNGINPPDTLLSLSATAPTMPSGYNVFRRIGWVRNNSSSDLFEFIQKWSGRVRRYWWLEEGGSTLRILTNGSATIFTSVDASSLIPPTSTNGTFSVAFETDSGGTSNNGVWIRPAGSTLTNPVWRNSVGVVSTEKIRTQSEIPTDTSQAIEYKVPNAANDVSIYVAGFDDDI